MPFWGTLPGWGNKGYWLALPVSSFLPFMIAMGRSDEADMAIV